MAEDQDITPAILLRHMQAMESRIMERFGKVDARFAQVDARFAKLEHRMDVLTTGVDNIDKRLDDIEIELLPKRVAALEEAVGIGR